MSETFASKWKRRLFGQTAKSVAEPDLLEEALRFAASFPEGGADFLRLVLGSKVFVIGERDVTNEHIATGGSILLEKRNINGKTIQPFFSSQSLLESAVEAGTPFLCLDARALFVATRGETLWLNPLSEFSKEFSPEEVAQLLDFGIGSWPDEVIVKENTTILIRSPQRDVGALKVLLKRFFSRYPAVNAAHLAEVSMGLEGQISLLIGLETEGEISHIAADTLTVLGGLVSASERIDFIKVSSSDGGVSQHFLRVNDPFYRHGETIT